MGLKSGSRDAGLDDEDDEGEAAPATDAADESADEPTGTTGSTAEASGGGGDGGTDGESGGGRPSMESIPYKLRRDKVNEGRQQVPYFLRDDVIDAEDDLQDALEAMLGEDVYKSDYREAAMVVAQRNPELVAEVLREWGYDLD